MDACQQGLVSARDAAIDLLSLLTGLCACDIRGLQLADIDWRRSTIGIVQQKTGNPLTLPLPPLVMASWPGYVLDERCSSNPLPSTCPKSGRCRQKTIEAYRLSLECFVDYLIGERHIDRKDIGFDHFERRFIVK